MITVDYARVGITMEKEIKRFSQIYPWYAGFTGDLLFYIAVDTLFLTVVKEFSAAMGLSFSAILLSHPMRLVMAISFAISVIEILLGIKLYSMVAEEKTDPTC
jgi:hypothetical protein